MKEKYNNKPTPQFKRDVKRLEKGEPVDYVIGFTEFLGCKIDLSKRPLIPRPETEFWAEKAMGEIIACQKFNGVESTLSRDFYTIGKIRATRGLDIFAGSGCVGLAVLAHVKNSEVVFADTDRKCVEQIKINLKLNHIRANKKMVVRSDVFSNIKGKYNFILANPPYIAETRKNKIQKSVLKYEPKKALFAGKDGLFYINKFLRKARNHLNESGKIYMEFDSPQKSEIKKLSKKYGYKNCKFHKDQYNKWRWVVIQ